MADLIVKVISRAGLNLDTDDVAADVAGDKFPNTGAEFLYVNNANASSRTLTLTTPNTVDGQAVGDRQVTVPGLTKMLIGPFPKNIYNDVDDKVAVGYSAVTDVTVAAVRLGT